MIAHDYNDDWMNFSIKMNEQFHYLREESFMLDHKAEFLNEDVEILQEAVSDKIREFWKNLKKKIKELWARFKMMIDRLVKNDRDWLVKYKGRIMNAKLDDFEHEIHPYWKGSSVLQQTRIPAFNAGNEDFMQSLEDESTFREKHFGHLKDLTKDSENFVENLKENFRGGDKLIVKGSALKSRISGMYEYCMQYKSIAQAISRDYNNVQKSVDAAERESARVANGPDQDAAKSEGMDFLSLLMEADASPPAEKKETQTDRVAKFKDNVDSSKKTDEDSVRKVDNGSKEKANKNLDRYRTYVLFCQKVLGAKQSVYEERYREYTRLLKRIAGIEQGSSGTVASSKEDLEKKKDEVKNDNGAVGKVKDLIAKRKALRAAAKKLRGSSARQKQKEIDAIDKQIEELDSEA
jgi:hypothetical protein